MGKTISPEYAEYLKEKIREWETLREEALPYVHDKTLEASHYHDVWSHCAQVLLLALREADGYENINMRDVMEGSPSFR